MSFQGPISNTFNQNRISTGIKGPVNIDIFAVQHRILAPNVTAGITKSIQNIIGGLFKQSPKANIIPKSPVIPKATNPPRTGPSVSSVAKAGIIGGSAVGTSIAFTQIIGDLTKPTPTGGTAGADIIKPVAESIGSFSGAAEGISNFVQSNPGTILLLGGGILLILLIK